MPQIHMPESNYNAPVPHQGWQWLPYTDQKMLANLKLAISIIDSKIKHSNSCNDAFKKLPGKKTFLQVWNDDSVWISFDPNRKGITWAVMLSKKHITLSAYTLAMGPWHAAATLVHELAHVNDAPHDDKQAEGVLLSCLLKSLHDPEIIGQLIRSKKFQPLMLA